MKIIFYDVEHGNCTHIITPNGKHILIDVGSRTDKSIVSYIKNKYFNVNNGGVDALIITHPHEDHIYDLLALYNNLKPKSLHRPKEAFDIVPTCNTHLNSYIANRMNNDYPPLSLDDNPLIAENNGGVEIEIISPPILDTTKTDLNTFSSIIIVKYKGCKFVLTGDNPKSILQSMMDNNTDGIKQKVANATALLAPHHGRTGEFCKTFFDLVKPILTIVSDKSVTHTTQYETSNVYKGTGCTIKGRDRYVLTTRNDGNIMFNVKAEKSCVVSMNNDY